MAKVNGKEFYYEIVLSQGMGKLTNKAKKMIMILAVNAITKKPFRNIDDKHDCLQTALMCMYSNWYKFNKNKSKNTFAYFTEIFKRGSAQGFDLLYKKKGDPNNEYKIVYMHAINEGEGMFNA